jgi:hypothetical protein
MKPTLCLLAIAAQFLGASLVFGQTTDTPIDWERAKQLYQREQRGQTLSPEDQAYLNRAKEIRNRGNQRPGTGGDQRKLPASLKPLSDMAADESYERQTGGLYGDGSNEPPAALRASAGTAIASIQPLDAEGNPAVDGKIVLISISMSNATQEFATFKQMAHSDPRKAASLTIVDCAQGGQAMAEWAPEDAGPWREALSRLDQAGVSPRQVQVAWIKLANKNPRGTMQEHLEKLETDTTKVLQNAKARFPNLRIAYLGSRIWGGNATGSLNPEPYAYEGAFAVRHLIQRQMAGVESLAAGKAPLLLWGPYLWAEGEKGRQLDGLKYIKADFANDGVHPAPSGREKVARLLLEFFANDPLAKGWFAK